MSLEPQALTGLVLIAVGVGLALLAVALIVTRGDGQAGEKQDEPSVQAEQTPPPEPAAAPAPASVVAEGPASGPIGPAGEPAPRSTRAEDPIPPRAEPAPQPFAGAVPGPGGADRTYPVTTLRRDEVTGSLSVEVEGRRYGTADELRLSNDWTRVQYAASDLMKWLAATDLPARPKSAARDEAPGKPASMIEQINAILDRRLAGSSGDRRGIRLFEGTDGSVRVFVGLNSYEIDSVPDEDVRQIIRDAVAEWEASQ